MILEIVFFLLLGFFVGSFINVVIYRIPKNQGFIKGRSYCDNCKKNLKWYDLIPLVSYIVLRGRCRFCKKRITLQIPLVEFITGIFFILTFLKFPMLGFSFIFYIFVVCSLISIFFIDLNKGIIPNKVLYPISIATLIFVYFAPNFINHIISAFVSFIFFFLIYFFTKGKGMGFGDVKFAGFLGLLFGFPLIVINLYTAFLTGGLASLILIIWGKKHFKKDTIAFGPFLSFGGITTIFLGDLLVSRLLSFLR